MKDQINLHFITKIGYINATRNGTRMKKKRVNNKAEAKKGKTKEMEKRENKVSRVLQKQREFSSHGLAKL